MRAFPPDQQRLDNADKQLEHYLINLIATISGSDAFATAQQHAVTTAFAKDNQPEYEVETNASAKAHRHEANEAFAKVNQPADEVHDAYAKVNQPEYEVEANPAKMSKAQRILGASWSAGDGTHP